MGVDFLDCLSGATLAKVGVKELNPRTAIRKTEMVWLFNLEFRVMLEDD